MQVAWGGAPEDCTIIRQPLLLQLHRLAVNSPAYVLLLSLIVYPRLPVVAVRVVRDAVEIALHGGVVCDDGGERADTRTQVMLSVPAAAKLIVNRTSMTCYPTQPPDVQTRVQLRCRLPLLLWLGRVSTGLTICCPLQAARCPNKALKSLP